jgi:hypothetical protein
MDIHGAAGSSSAVERHCRKHFLDQAGGYIGMHTQVGKYAIL